MSATTDARFGLIKDSLQEAQKAAKLMLSLVVGESHAFWQCRYNEATAALDALDSIVMMRAGHAGSVETARPSCDCPCKDDCEQAGGCIKAMGMGCGGSWL